MFSRDEYEFIGHKMQKQQKKRDGSRYFAVSASDADNNLESKNVDVLLLGPQVRFMKAQFEQNLRLKVFH